MNKGFMDSYSTLRLHSGRGGIGLFFAIQSLKNRQSHGRAKGVIKSQVKVALRVILRFNRVEKNEAKSVEKIEIRKARVQHVQLSALLKPIPWKAVTKRGIFLCVCVCVCVRACVRAST